MIQIPRLVLIVCSLVMFVVSSARAAESDLFKEAMRLYGQNDFSGCSKVFAQLVREHPQKGLYWFNLGNCYFMSAHYKYAQIAYNQVIKMQSKLGPAAMLYQAKVLKAQGRVLEAQKMLQDLILLNPSPGIRAEAEQELENQALALYQGGKYKEVEAQLRAQPEKDLSDNDKLLLALSLIKQNKSEEASTLLKNLVGSTTLTSENRGVVNDLLSQSKESAKSSQWIFMDVAYGTTSNAYLEGRSLAPVSSPLVRANFGVGGAFYSGQSWTAKASYLFDYESPTQATELTTQNHSLQAPVVFKRRDLELGAVPYFQMQYWSGSPVSQRTGMLSRNSFYRQNYEFGCDLDFSSQKSLSDQSSYLTGSSYSVRPFIGYLGGSFSAQLYWLMGFDGSQDITYLDGSLLPLQNNYQGPGLRLTWKVNESMRLLVQSVYLERTYKNVELPQNKSRKDQEINLSGKLTYAFSKNWIIYLLAEYNPNKSTLDETDVRDKNYNNTNLLVGVGWEAF